MSSQRCRAASAVVLALALTAGSGAAQAAPSPTVAVLDFTGLVLGESGNSGPFGKAVSAMLVTELTGRPGLRVIERANVQDVLQEHRLSLSGMVEDGQALQVGRLLGAQYVIYGQVTDWAGDLRMDVRAVDVETSAVLEAVKLRGRSEELLDHVVQVADDFTRELRLEPPSSRPAVVPVPPRATIEFSRAVDYEDRGDVQQAIQHYRATLEIHPEHAGARQALERLQGPGGGA